MSPSVIEEEEKSARSSTNSRTGRGKTNKEVAWSVKVEVKEGSVRAGRASSKGSRLTLGVTPMTSLIAFLVHPEVQRKEGKSALSEIDDEERSRTNRAQRRSFGRRSGGRSVRIFSRAARGRKRLTWALVMVVRAEERTKNKQDAISSRPSSFTRALPRFERLTRVRPGVNGDLVSKLVLESEHLRSGDDSGRRRRQRRDEISFGDETVTARDRQGRLTHRDPTTKKVALTSATLR